MTTNCDTIDTREQLFNGNEQGRVERVSLPMEMITSVSGIMIDIDPDLLNSATVPVAARADPEHLFRTVVEPMLSRHPAYAGAEARSSGRGLHVIIRMSPPVVFEKHGDRQRWGGVVPIVQRILPSDPDCPGITALTRPLGSINGKNGRPVRQLRCGSPVTPETVLQLFRDFQDRPFLTVARVRYGSDQIDPCPICKRHDRRLTAQNFVGSCYGGCGKKVTLDRLLGAAYERRVLDHAA